MILVCALCCDYFVVQNFRFLVHFNLYFDLYFDLCFCIAIFTFILNFESRKENNDLTFLLHKFEFEF